MLFQNIYLICFSVSNIYTYILNYLLNMHIVTYIDVAINIMIGCNGYSSQRHTSDLLPYVLENCHTIIAVLQIPGIPQNSPVFVNTLPPADHKLWRVSKIHSITLNCQGV